MSDFESFNTNKRFNCVHIDFLIKIMKFWIVSLSLSLFDFLGRYKVNAFFLNRKKIEENKNLQSASSTK